MEEVKDKQAESRVKSMPHHEAELAVRKCYDAYKSIKRERDGLLNEKDALQVEVERLMRQNDLLHDSQATAERLQAEVERLKTVALDARVEWQTWAEKAADAQAERDKLQAQLVRDVEGQIISQGCFDYLAESNNDKRNQILRLRVEVERLQDEVERLEKRVHEVDMGTIMRELGYWPHKEAKQ